VHNLCTHTQPPPGFKSLLGLGLKYCIATPNYTPDIKKYLLKMAYNIRTKQYLLKNNPSPSGSYIPQIYVKLKDWNPPPASTEIENRITLFEKHLKKTIETHTHHNIRTSNLTITQHQTMKALRENKDFIIMPTDKNLGPAIMNRDEYIKQCLTDHLLTPHYIQLTKKEALGRISYIRDLLTEIYNNHKKQLSQAETTYFTRSFKLNHRIPIFYGMPKVHKNPLTFRPVVSCVNSFSSIFSNWLDYKMKDLLFLIPSYIKDSKHLLDEIKNLTLPPNAKLFTADATAMYTNIDIKSGIITFEKLFDTYDNLIPKDFPRELFIKVLRTIMENNIFTFGDTYWLQTQGTAMGTPAAPLYSILTFGYHENTSILPNFKSQLIYYKRFIDDIFGIWIEDTKSPSQSEHIWNNFKEKINQFSILKWNIEPLTLSTTFMDLCITIKDDRIITTTYQKPLNLYLYIPPLSAHPPSCFKGLVTGELHRYWTQNTNEADFISITTKFILRLIQRGHQLNQILPILQTAAYNIENTNTKEITSNTTHDDTLYIHWQFHPSSINKHTIRKIYNNTLKDHDGFQSMRIAMSRTKNLRDILCKTNLPDITHKNVSDILHKITDEA
jgi:hypothetical protein